MRLFFWRTETPPTVESLLESIKKRIDEIAASLTETNRRVSLGDAWLGEQVEELRVMLAAVMRATKAELVPVQSHDPAEQVKLEHRPGDQRKCYSPSVML